MGSHNPRHIVVGGSPPVEVTIELTSDEIRYDEGILDAWIDFRLAETKAELKRRAVVARLAGE